MILSLIVRVQPPTVLLPDVSYRMTCGVGGGRGFRKLEVTADPERGVNDAVLFFVFLLVFSADPESGVNDDAFFFLFLSAYLFSRGDEREYSEARSNSSPHRAAGLTRVLVPHQVVR